MADAADVGHPAFETLPSATDIAHWYAEEMHGKPNVGGDAWWLCREPHSSARLLAFIDFDVQEFALLDIATEDSRDLLMVSHGLDGLWCDWWQHPRSTSDAGDDYYDWHRDGVAWLADQMVVHFESGLHRD